MLCLGCHWVSWARARMCGCVGRLLAQKSRYRASAEAVGVGRAVQWPDAPALAVSPVVVRAGMVGNSASLVAQMTLAALVQVAGADRGAVWSLDVALAVVHQPTARASGQGTADVQDRVQDLRPSSWVEHPETIEMRLTDEDLGSKSWLAEAVDSR